MDYRSAGKVLLGGALVGVALASAGVASAENEQNVQRSSEIGVVNAQGEVRVSEDELSPLAGASEVRAADHGEAWSTLGEQRYMPFHSPSQCAGEWDPGNVSTAAVGGNLTIPGVFDGAGC